MLPEEDGTTKFMKRAGFPYARLAAASADAVPSPKFDTTHVRTNQHETIRVLTEENGRLVREREALQAQLRKYIRDFNIIPDAGEYGA